MKEGNITEIIIIGVAGKNVIDKANNVGSKVKIEMENRGIKKGK